MTSERPRLLLVDDHEMNRDMLARRLERRGYQVMSAEGGRRALELMDAHEFALVLLDIEMPEMSGLDVLKEVRQRRSLTQLPVVMVTARHQSESVVEALQAGANDYVTKPIDFAIALARIETQLARQRAEAALRESEERYALAVRGANDGLWDWNLRTDVVYFSPRWKMMLGLAEEDVCGRPDDWFRRVHQEEIDRLRAAIAAHVDGLTEHFEIEHRMLHVDGTFRWMRTRGLAVRDDSGRAYRMAGSQTDITDGKVADALTGLPNRILFLDRLAHAVERAKRRRGLISAVLFLDLDRFKLVNDSLGHVVGDQLLVAVARRLESSLRSSDMVARLGGDHTIARLGGDEFTILLEDLTELSDALRVAERIQDQLSHAFRLDERELFTSASIGIATTATPYDSPQALLRDADTAMYRAKASGGARCELFDSEMRDLAIARLQLETDIKHALERGEFTLHYQPIISLADGGVSGFEALIRWAHPRRGMVPPSEFVPIAEETGTITIIGRWVLGEACRQLQRWIANAGNRALTMSVNVSGRQFFQADLLDDVRQVLAQTRLPAANLKLEVTESTIMERDGVCETLDALRRLGVQLALDDFGTGYSSLSHVHRFPLNSLKIDRSFIRSLDRSDNDVSIVGAIIDLAHKLRLGVVAEGIETKAQLAALKSLGCEYGQGYLFSAPVDAAAAEKLLAADLVARGQ